MFENPYFSSFSNNDFSDINYFKLARDSYLQRKINSFPNITFGLFRIAFTINASAKNGVLVYAILESFPDDVYSIQKNKVIVEIKSEDVLMDIADQMFDLLTVVRSWKSLEITFDESTLDFLGVRYLVNYFFDTYNKTDPWCGRQVEGIKSTYLTAKRKQRKSIDLDVPRVDFSCNSNSELLEAIIQQYVLMYGTNKTCRIVNVSSEEKVLVIEDSLLVDFYLTTHSWIMDIPVEHDYACIMIQELTRNDLFKFNWAAFRRAISGCGIATVFHKFHGFNYYYTKTDRFNYLSKVAPELDLAKRSQDYMGEMYHFVLLRMVDNTGRMVYGIGYTKNQIHPFILKIGEQLQTLHSRSLELNGVSCIPYRENKAFVTAFLSWQGEKKKKRMETHFSYIVISQPVANDALLYKLPQEYISRAYAGEFDDREIGYYTKPINRWKNEELVYNITKKLFKNYQVVYQHRPYYLNGLSYDVYICGLKVAIEYQGKQHFEPVEYFGGKENFEKQQQRDREKARLSQENGVKLVYINYWENITPELIKERVEE